MNYRFMIEKDPELFYLVRAVINDWDPINILFTVDEYDPEVGNIAYLLKKKPDMSVNDLAEEIHEVFTRWFNDGIFQYPKESCLPIARKILESIIHAG